MRTSRQLIDDYLFSTNWLYAALERQNPNQWRVGQLLRLQLKESRSMHLSSLEEVTKLARELHQVDTDLGNVRDAACVRVDFKYPYPGTGFWYATPSSGCNESAGDGVGVLAAALRDLFVDHYTKKRDAICARLIQLGVVVE